MPVGPSLDQFSRCFVAALHAAEAGSLADERQPPSTPPDRLPGRPSTPASTAASSPNLSGDHLRAVIAVPSSASRRPRHQPALQQERLDHIRQRARVLAHRRRERLPSRGPPWWSCGSSSDAPVDLVQPDLIHALGARLPHPPSSSLITPPCTLRSPARAEAAGSRSAAYLDSEAPPAPAHHAPRRSTANPPTGTGCPRASPGS